MEMDWSELQFDIRAWCSPLEGCGVGFAVRNYLEEVINVVFPRMWPV